MDRLPFELRRLLGETRLQPWLIRELEVFEASQWAQMAALGRISRLGLATELTPADALARMLEGQPSLSDRVREEVQARAIDGAALLEMARHRSVGLGALIGCVSPIPGAAPSGPRQWARVIARERDDLESAVWVLRAVSAPKASVLDAELRPLDQRATRTKWLQESLRWVQDERLSEVAWQTPDVWWGALGDGAAR
jgi:hypothetical protein